MIFSCLKLFLKDSRTLAAKEKEVKKITDGLNALQEASNKDAEALAAAQQHFNAVSAGLSSNEDGEEATLAGQMMACKNDISKAQTEAKQVNTDINYCLTLFFFWGGGSCFALYFGSCYKTLTIIRSLRRNLLFCHFIAPNKYTEIQIC